MKALLAIYPLAILSLFFFYLDEVVRSSFLILFSSLILLALSMVVDVFIDRSMILEDGFKFLGISGWFLYYFDTNKKALLKLIKYPENMEVKHINFQPEENIERVEKYKL